MSTENVDAFLEHFGIKGMRWGVRRESPSTPSVPKTPTPVTVITKPNTSKIATRGGERQPASDDAKRTASVHQKLRKSGVNSLSNREMQDLVTRLNLEQQLTRLTEPQKSQYQQMMKKTMNKALSKGLSKVADQAVQLLMKQAMDNLKKK